MPKSPLSDAPRPLNAQPRLTIETVFKCPTTVELTAPLPATMKNWEMLELRVSIYLANQSRENTYLIREANPPLMRIITHLYVGTVWKSGILSINGTANSNITLEIGA